MLAIRTILHPTDFSPLAQHALDVARGLASDYHARLVLLHVHEPPVPMGELVEVEPPFRREALLRDLQELAPAAAIATECRVEEGSAAETILKIAGEIQPDLIVLSSHGRTGLRRALLGSVAEAVVRKAPCLVLTVKPGSGDQILAGKS